MLRIKKRDPIKKKTLTNASSTPLILKKITTCHDADGEENGLRLKYPPAPGGMRDFVFGDLGGMHAAKSRMTKVETCFPGRQTYESETKSVVGQERAGQPPKGQTRQIPPFLSTPLPRCCRKGGVQNRMEICHWRQTSNRGWSFANGVPPK